MDGAGLAKQGVVRREERHPILRGHHVPEQLHGPTQTRQVLPHLCARLSARFPAGGPAPRHPEQPGQLLLGRRPLRRRRQGGIARPVRFWLSGVTGGNLLAWFSGRRDDADAATLASARPGLDDDLHVLTQGRQEPHQPIAGEAGKPAVHEG